MFTTYDKLSSLNIQREDLEKSGYGTQRIQSMHGLSSIEYSVFVSVTCRETFRLSKGDTKSSNMTTNKSTIDVHSEVQLPLQSTIQIKTYRICSSQQLSCQ